MQNLFNFVMDLMNNQHGGFHAFEDLFRKWEQHSSSRILRKLMRCLRILVLTIKQGAAGYINHHAAALTYFTMLSLVPMLAVVFSLLSAFGGLDKLKEKAREQILEYIVAGNKQHIIDYLNQFIANIHSTTIGVLGFSMLLIVAIFMLHYIETAFNRIWLIKHPRSFMRKITIYAGVLTLGPLLIGLSLTISASFLSSSFVTWMMQEMPLGRHFLKAVPLVASWCFFSLLFYVVPQTRVKRRAALTSGVATGCSFEILKGIYGWITTRFFAYDVIYGSLGVLPILLIWFNWVWQLVLYGAQLSFVLQHDAVKNDLDECYAPINQAARESFAWRAVVCIGRDYHQGRTPPSIDYVASFIGAPSPLAILLIDLLQRTGIIRTIEAQDGVEGYIPGHDLKDITLAMIITALRHEGGEEHLPKVTELVFADQSMACAEKNGLERARQTCLYDIVNEPEVIA